MSVSFLMNEEIKTAHSDVLQLLRGGEDRVEKVYTPKSENIKGKSGDADLGAGTSPPPPTKTCTHIHTHTDTKAGCSEGATTALKPVLTNRKGSAARWRLRL